MIGSAEAKEVTYKVNGKQYSYDTNNDAEKAAARRHIKAARAAAAAKAKADAERASNPLVVLFGSAVQRKAAKAEELLEQARPGNAPASQDQAITPPSEERHEVEKPETFRPNKPVTRIGRRVAPDLLRPAPKEPQKPVVATKPASAPAAPGRVKSMFFDAMSGIKTTFMADGSVHEESFDGSMLPTIASEPSGSSSLNAFVDQMRSVAPVETTGSTWTAASP